MMDSVSEEDKFLLTETEHSLLALEATGDSSWMEKAGNDLALVNRKETANREFLAWRACLNAEYLIRTRAKGFERKAEQWLDEALKYNRSEQRISVVRALLAGDPEKKRELLEKGASLPWASRIHIDLGLFYFSTGEFRLAAAAFDNATDKVPGKTLALFSRIRDQAFTLRNSQLSQSSSAGILGKEELSLIDVILVVSGETSLLEGILSEDPNHSEINRLIDKGKIPSPVSAADAPLFRGDAALFFTSLIALKKGVSGIAQSSADYYIERGWSSPMEDVSVDSEWFNAAIYCVEEEILDLPDGMGFEPTRPLSGAEMSQALKVLRKLYPPR